MSDNYKTDWTAVFGYIAMLAPIPLSFSLGSFLWVLTLIILTGWIYLYNRDTGELEEAVCGWNRFTPEGFLIPTFAWALLIVDVVWFLLCLPKRAWRKLAKMMDDILYTMGWV